MFDEKYVINNLKSELTQIEKERLLIETADDDKLFKEKLFIMFHNKVDNLHESALNKFARCFKAIYSYHKSSIIETNLHEFLPIVVKKLESKSIGGFNALQDAAYTAQINSTPELFQQFCNEVELFGLGLGYILNHNCLVENYTGLGLNGVVLERDWDKVISKINENYPLLPMISPFGYNYLSNDGLICEIKKNGYKNFIKNLNNEVTRLIEICAPKDILKPKLSGLYGIGYHLEGAPIDIKSGIVEEIKKLEVVSPYFYCLIVPMLMTEPLLRQSSRIIEYMPIRNNDMLLKLYENDVLKLNDYLELCNYIKVSEIELGINNLKHVVDTSIMYNMCGVENIESFATNGFEMLSEDGKDAFSTIFYLDYCQNYIQMLGRERRLTESDIYLEDILAISGEEIDSSIGWVEILSDLRDEKTCKLEDASILFKTFLNLIKGRNLKLACPELFKNINPQNIHQFINSPHVSKSLEEHYLRFWTTNKYLKVDRYALEIFGNLAKIIENSRL